MNLTTTQVALGYFMYYLNPFYAILFTLRFFNVNYYVIQGDKETISRIIRKLMPYIKTAYIKQINGREMNTGYFVGKRAIGNIELGNEDFISVITTPEFYAQITCPDECSVQVTLPPSRKPSEKINVYTRRGTFKNFYYLRVSLDLGHISPLGQQHDILNKITDVYSKLGRATFFIHGDSCTGKSTIGYLLAKQMCGNYCHTFNPCDPGDNLISLLTEVTRDEQPIILVIEEVDGLLRAIHDKTLKPNQEVPSLVYNKSSWCTFLDDMTFYRGLILILTSNTSKEKIDELDVAYLRPGRIHANYSMNVQIEL
jgi:hypothetical protein